MRASRLQINRGGVVGHIESRKVDSCNGDGLRIHEWHPQASLSLGGDPCRQSGTSTNERQRLPLHNACLGEGACSQSDHITVRRSVNGTLNRGIGTRNQPIRCESRSRHRHSDSHDSLTKHAHVQPLRLGGPDLHRRSNHSNGQRLAVTETATHLRRVRDQPKNSHRSREPDLAPRPTRPHPLAERPPEPHRGSVIEHHPPHRSSNPSRSRNSAAMSASGVPSCRSNSRRVRRIRIDTMRVTVRPSSTE